MKLNRIKVQKVLDGVTLKIKNTPLLKKLFGKSTPEITVTCNYFSGLSVGTQYVTWDKFDEKFLAYLLKTAKSQGNDYFGIEDIKENKFKSILQDTICEMARNNQYDEIKKEIRDFLKKEKIKFSLRTSYSRIDLQLLEGPIDFISNYLENTKNNNLMRSQREMIKDKQWVNINHYYYKDEFTGKALKVIGTLVNIMNKKQGEPHEDSDYGSIPTYYIHIEIGDLSKPYKVI